MLMGTYYGSLQLKFGRECLEGSQVKGNREGELGARLMLKEVPGNIFLFLRRFLDSNCWRWDLCSSLRDSSFLIDSEMMNCLDSYEA